MIDRFTLRAADAPNPAQIVARGPPPRPAPAGPAVGGHLRARRCPAAALLAVIAACQAACLGRLNDVSLADPPPTIAVPLQATVSTGGNDPNSVAAPAPNPNTPASPSIVYVGRIVPASALPAGVLARFSWPGVAMGFHFRGTALTVTLSEVPRTFLGDSGRHYFDVVVDGTLQPEPVVTSAGDPADIAVATGLTDGEHTVWMTKRTEAMIGSVQVHDVALSSGGAWLDPPARRTRRLEVIGASADAGYGVEAINCSDYQAAQQNQDKAWPQLAANALGAELHNISFSNKGILLNWAPVDDRVTAPMMYTYTDPNLEGVPWDFSQWIGDVVVITPGGNDFSGNGGQPPPADAFNAAYVGLIAAIARAYPAAHIYAMLNPIVDGLERDQLRGLLTTAVNTAVASGLQRVHFKEIPLYQGGVYGCVHHPTPQLHQVIADTMVAAIRADLGWRDESP